MKFTEFFSVLFKWRKVLYFNFFTLLIISLILAFLIPKSYIVTASFIPTTSIKLPSTREELYYYIGITPLTSRFGEVINMGDIFASFLKKEKIMIKVIEKTDLMKKKNLKNLRSAVKWLRDRVKINVSPEGVVEISVITRDKYFSAEIANAFIDALKELTEDLYSSYTRWKLRFLEDALHRAKKNVVEFADSLARLKKRYNIFEIGKEYSSSYEVYAKLKEDEIRTEIEIKTLQSYVSPDNPQIKKLKEQLSNIRKKLKEFEMHPKPMGFGGAFGTPLKNLADVYSLLLRTETEYKAMERVYNYLSEEYEKAKVETETKVPLIEVLNEAEPELADIFPRKWMIVALGLFVFFLFGIPLCFYFEFLEVLKSKEEFSHLKKMLENIKRDFIFWKEKG